MKKIIFLAFLLSITIKSYSQESNFSMDLNYPITMDSNFIGANYNGIIDLGFTYVFSSSNPVNFGFSLNGGILQNNSNKNVGNPFKVTSYVVQPRAMVQMNPSYSGGFSPFLGLGYSLMFFDVSGDSNGFTDAAGESQGGFNFNLGLGYDFSESFYAKVQYDFINSSVSDGVPNVKYNKHISLLKIGLGYRF